MPQGARTAEERRGDIDKEMDAALAEMDELLLKEKKILAQERSEAMTASASSSGGGGAGGMGGGMSAGGASGGQAGATGSEASEGGQSASGGANTSGGSGSAPTGSHNASGAIEGSPSEDSEERKKRIPPDIPDGRDDDIVARQLREAAINEDDPELREKLWDEYRKYKSGQR